MVKKVIAHGGKKFVFFSPCKVLYLKYTLQGKSNLSFSRKLQHDGQIFIVLFLCGVNGPGLMMDANPNYDKVRPSAVITAVDDRMITGSRETTSL